MKRWLLLVMVLAISACAMMGGRTVNVTGAQLEKKLNEKLSVPFALLKVFNVNLSNAVVRFDQPSGRIFTTMDTALTSQLFNKSMRGQLGISGKLRFDAPSSAVVFDEPKIESLHLDGMDAKGNEIVSGLAKTVAGQMLNGLTLYKVNPEDLNYAGVQYQPKDLQITNTGLQILLSPQR